METVKQLLEMNKPKLHICTERVIEADYLRSYANDLGIGDQIVINGNCARNRSCRQKHEALLNKMQICKQNWNSENDYLVHGLGYEKRPGKTSFYDTLPRAWLESDIISIMHVPSVEYWFLLHFDMVDEKMKPLDAPKVLKNKLNEIRAKSNLAELTSNDYETGNLIYPLLGGKAGVDKALENAKKLKFDEMQNYIETFYNCWQILKEQEEDDDSESRRGNVLKGLIALFDKQPYFSNMHVLLNKFRQLSE